MSFFTPTSLLVIATVCVCVLAASVPFALWYYWRAKNIAPELFKKKELEETNAKLQEENDKLRDDVAKGKDTLSDAKAAKEWMEKSRQEIQDLVAQLAKAREACEGARQQFEDAKAKVSEKQLELGEINTKLADAEARTEKLRKEKEQLVPNVESLKAQKAQLLLDVENGLKELQSVEQSLAQKKSEHDKISAEVEKLRQEKSRLEAEKTKLENDSKVLCEDIDNLRNRAAQMKGEVAEALETISHRKAIINETNDKWHNLELKIVSEESTRTFSEINENDWLSQFETQLQQSGFIFNQRAIRAFHTGLKCAKTSPLVVLAGISGTGKSLLPELYSAALGMNFLSVPVQPRWDSPQDLFGFYNYMEGRYKATELARLLWQFDIHNNPEAKRLYPLGELPVNLVLLDEMNLARVEYYFSDLLSKLETRNGLDERKDSERKKAEIELECNAADKVESTRHLFVSSHTLFVGTMNEDESTQALSDKVIDRSNVLRFGRPKDLNARPEKSRFLDECQTGGRISAAAWDSWCISLTNPGARANGLTALEKTLMPVVEALTNVGRPYGFRVDNAMKTYILNYPGSVQHAIADQIEMKILPKLNGLELETAGFSKLKETLKDAIHSTSDFELEDAFLRSCPNDGTFFKWRGVMR